MEQNEVAIAFDIVLEEIENAIAALNQQGAEAFQNGKYDVARDLMEKGSQMAAFRTKVNDLQKEWLNIFATVTPPKTRRRSRKVAERLKRGLRTPEDAFRVPILQSLTELGGSGAMADVLDRVEVTTYPFCGECAKLSLWSSSRWKSISFLKRFASLETEVARLRAEVQHLRAENAHLKAENAELRRRLGLSSNSHKPPSSDGYRKKRVKPALPLQGEAVRRAKQRYHRILSQAKLEEPPPERNGGRGRPKSTPGRNLLRRLTEHEAPVCLCLVEGVPFANNQAERDLRPAKVKQKVSGCFRTDHGARVYARLQAVIFTCRKQERDVFVTLRSLFAHQPISLIIVGG